MKKCVGNIELPGRRLDYYVYGSHKSGYGIEIKETCTEIAEQIVSCNLEKAVYLAQKLQHGSVFPANLSEIVEDFQYETNLD